MFSHNTHNIHFLVQFTPVDVFLRRKQKVSAYHIGIHCIQLLPVSETEE